MKKVFKLLCVLSIIIINIFNLLCGVGCSNNSEVTISFKDEANYARYDSSVPGSGLGYTSSFMPYDGAISFEQYEEILDKSELYTSRCNKYVRFILTFNNTPKGYSAIDVYNIKEFKVDGRLKYVRSRIGNNTKQIEILIYLQNYTNTNNEHNVNSITYSYFDSVLGDKNEKTTELNYKFQTKSISNFFNRFNTETKFDATVVECTNQKIVFSVESNINYDKIVYNVDKRERNGSRYTSLVNEGLMDKSDSYIYETSMNEYYWYINIEIVGYQKDNVIYYSYPISYSLRYNN